MITGDALKQDTFFIKAIDTLYMMVDLGFEEEFEYAGHHYRLTGKDSSKTVSLWEDGQEQSFEDWNDFIDHATFGGRPLLEEFWQLPLGDLL